MKKETLKELGKGLIAFSNLIGGFSIINSFFGITHNVSVGITTFVIFYIVVAGYATGAILINKGAD
ncbi:MAG: hypothetical protein U9N42_00950 [Campylobacterota bacterium]|nr:hypothetical protein [Campylobacterota bacterium]